MNADQCGSTFRWSERRKVAKKKIVPPHSSNSSRVLCNWIGRTGSRSCCLAYRPTYHF